MNVSGLIQSPQGQQRQSLSRTGKKFRNAVSAKRVLNTAARKRFTPSVSIALIVSSIMIGIITYISVLERTKEIGILRSVGASKKDISRVFNAETVIVGFTAGLIGIGVTLLLNIPISIIAEKLTGIGGIAVLPATAAAILVAISVVLTMIAGLIPSKMAAKKDPVIALRTE